ncbi:MAG: HEAT repeat domain-containing protein [Gemmatimonadota bacterium]
MMSKKMDTRVTIAALISVAMGTAGAGEVMAVTTGASAFSVVSVVQQGEEVVAYRRAREAVAQGQFERAADLFSLLREQYPNTQYGANSYYWQAFAMYRSEALREALGVLESQLAEYPAARISEDARDLELRIRSMLGQRGDARSAERALREAEMALARTEMLVQRSTVRARDVMAMEIAAARAGAATQEGCEGDDVRQAALQALMQMETERALPLLRGVLERRDECSVALRKQAVFVLGQLDPADVEDLMIHVARTDPDPGVQEAAVFWLSQAGSDNAVSALSDLLESTENPVLQENAIFALSQNPGDRAWEVLRAYVLTEENPERVREKAISWLSQNADRADAAFLMDLYSRVEAVGLKEHIFITLTRRDDAVAVDWVLERALDTNEQVELRKQALFWAGQNSAIDLDRLRGLYERLADREMKEQLIFLYAQRQEPERVDRLIEIIESEEDVELRKRAIFWLGQTGDERAIEFLLRLAG